MLSVEAVQDSCAWPIEPVAVSPVGAVGAWLSITAGMTGVFMSVASSPAVSARL